MKQIIFAIHDGKAMAYLPPFFLHSEGMAKRSFGDCIADENHQFGKHPEDYTLFKIGEFDDARGVIIGHGHISLGNGTEYLPRDNNTIDLFEEKQA